MQEVMSIPDIENKWDHEDIEKMILKKMEE